VIQTQGKKEIREKFVDLERERQLSWLAISNLVRVSSQVAKEIVIMNVILPEERNDDGNDNNNKTEFEILLSSVLIREQILRRWVPQKDRS